MKYLTGLLVVFCAVLLIIIISLTDDLDIQIEKNKGLELELEKTIAAVNTLALMITPPYSQVKQVMSTAYNSLINQTDDSPFITANGDSVDLLTLALSRDLIRAESKFMEKLGYNPLAVFKFGDTLNVLYVHRVILRDTMAKRFTDRADIWLPEKSDAIKWGRRSVLIAKPQ